MTDYELQRAYNILEKNRMFQRLGLGKLRELVGTKHVVVAREESDPLYESRESIMSSKHKTWLIGKQLSPH